MPYVTQSIAPHASIVSVYRPRLQMRPRLAEQSRAVSAETVAAIAAQSAIASRHNVNALRGRYLARKAIATYRAAIKRTDAAQRAIAALRPITQFCIYRPN